MRLTEQQLVEMAEKAALTVECLGGSAYEHASNVVELIAEVRRCHALIKQAEWAADTEGWSMCPWCNGFKVDAVTGVAGHSVACSAFGSEA